MKHVSAGKSAQEVRQHLQLLLCRDILREAVEHAYSLETLGRSEWAHSEECVGQDREDISGNEVEINCICWYGKAKKLLETL